MNLGRTLVIIGLLIVALGVLVQVAPWLRFGRLPGDVSFTAGNMRVYFPIVTSIVVSIVLTLLASIFFRR